MTAAPGATPPGSSGRGRPGTASPGGDGCEPHSSTPSPCAGSASPAGWWSGIADAKSYKQLRADAVAGVPLWLQILVAQAAADGGGHWDGAVYFENLQIQSDSMGVVKFSAQMRGEGPLYWTDATS